jgi:16S rRNA (guanine(966)-N(2))-methyltransferase RsmD
MRVIAGSAKATRLTDAPSRQVTRPLTDRAKEALFSILMPYIEDMRFCDLCAGTGSVGIEALSRGAAWCDFVDRDRHCTAIILENLRKTRFSECAGVYTQDIRTFLTRAGTPYDCLFIGQPYFSGLFTDTIHHLDAHADRLLTAHGIVVAQAAPHEYDTVPVDTLQCYDLRRYGNVVFAFYRRESVTR